MFMKPKSQVLGGMALALGVGFLGLAGGRAMAEPAGKVAGAAAGRPEIIRVSATRSRLGLVEFDAMTREIFIPAEVNMVKGLLEYALVSEKGKLHESLLSTKARVFDLNVVLLLLNYEPDLGWFVPPSKPKALATVKPGARLEARVRWREAGGGAEKTVRLDQWIHDMATQKAAAPSPWVYSGSHLNETKQFAAEVDGSFLALYLDSRALFNSPRDGADNDEQWSPAQAVPEKGTAVTLILGPSSAP